MKYRIGYRTIKTAVGTSISIMIAQMLQLDNFVSAGILTILCIKVTKKKSLRASWDRFFACLMAMVFSSLFFEGIAYHPLVIGLLLLFFIPAAVMLRASDGIVTSSVIILHIYSAGEVSKELLLNELGIITVGIGVALIANLYMPSLESKLKEYRLEIEDNFKIIFDEIVKYLRTHESSWDGREITETMELIDKAKTLAFRDVENHFRRNDNLYYHYFKMREKQFEIIERVLPSVTSLALPVEQGEMIADFIEELSDHIHPGNTAIQFLDKLYRMRVSFENMELPKTREEFEARAALLHFVKEMEQYLIIKSSFKGLKDREMNQDRTAEAN
ncbi:aromatic acid exporter family protein [Cytobacillus oceanisediminis]|uniref:aromatic acid exporter family protein n=1 Tax=Cytobacillus TaxID=2675230 RepID=UPI001C22858E|nr:aromatic acid exporter family protein [Cytobacillus oceanisediminis]MBU8731378.1 aromatic acid exporter family protein [Cytobacillus oceanisediminis]MBY0154589.1 aromatic acid exporter family protein [Cytobacillus firmus]MCM3393808.1 aromatic acid exporter family protein [Cytobacillus oceanisediminis]MCM3529636.1 aromatic acid exporter family protein [Cytobacillus oceanisediminis]